MNKSAEPRLNIFISHSVVEKELADAWKVLLESLSLGTIKVWYSSDLNPEGGVPIGIWRTNLYEELEKADIVLAIQTPISNGRPWIMWECGVASGINRKRNIIPVVYSIKRGKLGNPLQEYQAFEGDNEEQVRELCTRLLVKEARLTTPKRSTLTPSVKAYMSKVQIHSPQQQVSREEDIAYWRDRLATFAKEGRFDELYTQRQLMYSSLSKGPLSFAIHDILSLYLHQQKKYAEALEEVDYALKLSSRNISLLHRKAMILLGKKEYIEAQKPIDQIIKLDQKLSINTEIAGLQGRLHREQWASTGDSRELDAAIEAYRRAYNADPSSYYAGLNTAELLILRGHIDEGKAIFQQVLILCQQLQNQPIVSFWVDFTVGEALFALDDGERAALEYRKGTQRNPAPGQQERDSAFGSVHRLSKVLQSPSATVDRIKEVLFW